MLYLLRLNLIEPWAFRYIGEFKNGDFYGNGKHEDLLTNVVYTGEFVENKKNGEGREFDPNTMILYDGRFKDSKRHGRGR